VSRGKEDGKSECKVLLMPTPQIFARNKLVYWMDMGSLKQEICQALVMSVRKA